MPAFQGLDFHRYRLLYVEDDPVMRDLTLVTLSKLFSDIRVAANGSDALALFPDFLPHIIITDLRMPRMDGLEFAARVRTENPDIPIIVTTAMSDVGHVTRAAENGIIHYLIKPIRVPELIDSVKKCLDGSLAEKT